MIPIQHSNSSISFLEKNTVQQSSFVTLRKSSPWSVYRRVSFQFNSKHFAYIHSLKSGLRSRASSLAVFRNVPFVFLSSVMRHHYVGLVLTTLREIVRIKKKIDLTQNSSFYTAIGLSSRQRGNDKMQRNRVGIKVEHWCIWFSTYIQKYKIKFTSWQLSL